MIYVTIAVLFIFGGIAFFDYKLYKEVETEEIKTELKKEEQHNK